MVKDHSDSERGNPPHGLATRVLLYAPSHRQDSTYQAFVTPVMEHWLEKEIAQQVHHEGSILWPIAPWANTLTKDLRLTPNLVFKRKEMFCLFTLKHTAATVQIAARDLLYAPSHRQDSTHHGLCYTSCGVLAITRNIWMAPCGGSGFPLSLSEWSFTICLTPYNRK